MVLINSISNLLQAVKTALFHDAAKSRPSAQYYEEQLENLKKLSGELEEQTLIEMQPLSTYEFRREVIESSTEPIEGIFFIIGGKLVPDYYSECLFSQKDNHSPHKRAMYHDYFLNNYIRNTYGNIAYDPKMIPRGRIQKLYSGSSSLIIDRCYYNDEDMLQKLIELYRLPGNISVSTNMDYRCPECRSKVREEGYGLISYVLQK